MREPRHGDAAICKHCGERIEYIEYTANAGWGHYEVLDAWWSHAKHPQDNHDAQRWERHDLSAAGDPIVLARLARENLHVAFAGLRVSLVELATSLGATSGRSRG